jgi:hypothetical protein
MHSPNHREKSSRARVRPALIRWSATLDDSFPATWFGENRFVDWHVVFNLCDGDGVGLNRRRVLDLEWNLDTINVTVIRKTPSSVLCPCGVVERRTSEPAIRRSSLAWQREEVQRRVLQFSAKGDPSFWPAGLSPGTWLERCIIAIRSRFVTM